MTTVATGAGEQLAPRTSIRAFRAHRYLLVVAEGELPTPGYEVDIARSPLRIFPQQFSLVRRERPGTWPDVITPYRYGEVVAFPPDQPVVVVHHAEGQDRVDIQECGKDQQEFALVVAGGFARPYPKDVDQALGFSRDLRVDEAFAEALADLAPPDSSAATPLTRVEVLEIGALVGEAAGLRNLFVRIGRHGRQRWNPPHEGGAMREEDQVRPSPSAQEANVFAIAAPIAVTYSRTSISGVPLFSYRDADRDLSFSGEEITTVRTPLGELVTVTIDQVVDAFDVRFTLVVPTVRLADGEPVDFETLAVETTDRSGAFVRPPGPVGALQTSRVSQVRGVASFAVS